MHSFYLTKNDPVWSDDMSLRVNATGQVLHVYVNGEYLSDQSATYGVFNYVFEKKIKLNPGPNKIILLSATIGLQVIFNNFVKDRIKDNFCFIVIFC